MREEKETEYYWGRLGVSSVGMGFNKRPWKFLREDWEKQNIGHPWLLGGVFKPTGAPQELNQGSSKLSGTLKEEAPGDLGDHSLWG